MNQTEKNIIKSCIPAVSELRKDYSSPPLLIISALTASTQNADKPEGSVQLLKEKEKRTGSGEQRVQGGSWLLSQQSTYLKHLVGFRNFFRSEQLRRRHKVFKGLSAALGTRSSEQCRRHHQQYQNRFGDNIDQIIDFLKARIDQSLKKPYLSQAVFQDDVSNRASYGELKINRGWFTILKIQNTVKILIKSDQIKPWTIS